MIYFSTHTYDDQTLRWLLPDPAMQFSNPYLGIGNNPVMNIDPDGEFIVLPALIGAGMGVLTNGLQNTSNGQRFFRGADRAAGIGAMFSVISAGISGAPNSLNSLAPTPSPSNLSLAVPVESLPGHVKRAIGEEGLANLSSKMNGSDYWNDVFDESNLVTYKKFLPKLDIKANGSHYVHHQPSRFRVAQAIQRAQTGSSSGYNFATDFTSEQLSWIRVNGGTYNSLVGDFPGVWTFGLSGTATAGLGINLSGGLALDFRNGFDIYGYAGAGPAYGVDVSLGGTWGHISPTRLSGYNFSVYDLEGLGATHNLGVGPFDLSIGSSPLYNTNGVGFSPVGLPAGYSYSINHTIVGRLW